MMVTSNVPHYSNLASELHGNYLFSSMKHAHDGSVVRTDYKLVQFQLQQLVVKFLIKQLFYSGLLDIK